jgi:predicted ATPase
MNVTGFKIEGFANIAYQSLDVHELNALIAPNGYGKSNILNAVEFGVKFIYADEAERVKMLASRFRPINESIVLKDFSFEICGGFDVAGREYLFQYGFTAAWASNDFQGEVKTEWLKMKQPQDQRFKQMLNRTNGKCLIVPSATGRCSKTIQPQSLQLALDSLTASNAMFLYYFARQIHSIRIPKLESLDNPESYFSMDGSNGIALLGGITLSEYMYSLKTTDFDNYSILKDGVLQLLPNIEDFSPEVVLLPDGQSKIYDIRVKEKYCTVATSIRQLSSGSKRMIFLFSLCVAAKKQNIPVILLEEPENSVHPQLMENLLLALQNYAPNTKILLTSHSPYLMRYLHPNQMFFGLPQQGGIAHFAQVNPAKLKYLARYAGDMELTFGEFMFEFMLDLENDSEKVTEYFIR